MKQKFLRFVPRFLRNRYGLGLTVLLLYITFFSDYDLYTTLKLRHQLHEMKQEREQYARDIKDTRERLHQLTSDQVMMEKFAREKWLMKRDNEDVFVLVAKH